MHKFLDFLSANVIDVLGSKDHVHFSVLQVEGHWYRFTASFVPIVEQLSLACNSIFYYTLTNSQFLIE